MNVTPGDDLKFGTMAGRGHFEGNRKTVNNYGTIFTQKTIKSTCSDRRHHGDTEIFTEKVFNKLKSIYL
jgi:hypothetical protein